MSLGIRIDVAKYRDEMNRFVTELNADATQLLREEMRLLLRDILRFTPPASYQQGRNAVRGDIGKLARPLDPAKIRMPRLAELVKKRDVAGIEALTARLGGGWAGRTLLRDLSAIQAAHIAARNPRGRVTGDKRNMAFMSDWKKYLTTIQDRVGWTRAGWWRAAQGVGLPLPSWVSKHQSYAPGGYYPPMPRQLAITAINRAIKIPNYEERYVFPALRARGRSLASELRRLVGGGKSRRASLANTPSGQAAIE